MWQYLVIGLLLINLVSCTLNNIAAKQEEATGLWEELVAGKIFGQTFACNRDNLYRIDLSTATYARTNTAPVIFHLQENPQASTDIISITIPGPEIQNDRPTSITFPPLSHSQGQSYYFYLESPQAAPGNAITVYANEHDRYPDGTAYRNGQPVAGDLVFTAYSQETYTFASVWGDFIGRVQQDIPFFICYGVLLLVVLGLLIVSLAKRASRSQDQ
jgi:hypothetical protein